jgi:putative ABC transport system permease protein
MEFIQIGTLYAIGYKRKEILLHYLNFPLIISLVGSILGTFVSFLLARPVLNFETYYYNLPILEYYKGEKYMIFSIILPVLILVTGAALVIWRALKLTPLKLMRGYKENRKAGWLEKKLRLNRMRFTSKFKIREITRSIPRMLILIIGVAAASLLLLLGFTIQNTFNYIVDEGFKNTYKYNYNYTFAIPQFENKYSGDIYNAAPFKETGSDEDFVVYGISGSKRMVDLKDNKGQQLDYNKNIRSVLTIPVFSVTCKK